MSLFNVYPLYEVTPVSAKGIYVYDKNNAAYLDLYGGHAVISIGHSHPKYVAAITRQVAKLGFYSNAVQNPLQEELSDKIEAVSGCKDYELFLCNSGAEANENALKLASFKTNKSRVIGGLDQANAAFFEQLDVLCKKNNTMFIADEVQSGYGRSGKFFAFQYYKLTPDIISIAKGMGNGFPIGGILIHPSIEAKYGMLGTTFGGNHLACVAGLSVLNVIEEEHLMDNATKMSAYFVKIAKTIPQVKKIKGKGLMLGLEFDFEVADLRKKLIYEHHIFTGGASNKKVLRILPPLNINKGHINLFFEALSAALDGLFPKMVK